MTSQLHAIIIACVLLSTLVKIVQVSVCSNAYEYISAETKVETSELHQVTSVCVHVARHEILHSGYTAGYHIYPESLSLSLSLSPSLSIFPSPSPSLSLSPPLLPIFVSLPSCLANYFGNVCNV